MFANWDFVEDEQTFLGELSDFRFWRNYKNELNTSFGSVPLLRVDYIISIYQKENTLTEWDNKLWLVDTHECYLTIS